MAGLSIPSSQKPGGASRAQTQILKLFCCTWNVAESETAADLTELLQTDASSLPDVYAVGLQEVDSILGSADSQFWTCKLTNFISPKGFVRVKSVLLQGMLLNVFVRRTCLPHTLHIESEITRTGFAGLWGDKGGVSIRLDIGGINLCFVNCHLAAHQDEVSSRIEDFSSIVEDQSFRDEDTDNILDHDYVFWLGDMNFRIDDVPRDVMLQLIKDQKYDQLWPTDQLLKVKQQELAFIDFEEGKLDFPPTYKFDIGTDTYDTSSKKRLPAWCDRILWMTHEDAFHDITLSVKQHQYRSVPSYNDSDHKPVIGVFDIVVFAKLPKAADVTFAPMNNWTHAKDAHFTYCVASDVTPSSSDWIALFPETFQNLYAYDTYVYATGTTGNQTTQRFAMSQVSGKAGMFRLCYFNGSDALLGTSEAFEIHIPKQTAGGCCFLF